jgi:energy-coupling factor transporter ATP-binding protein EcfA2
MDNIPAIFARGLTKTYTSGLFRKKKKEVLHGIDLDVARSALYGILGPNGAGKTTLLSILSALNLPDGGELSIMGLDARRQADRVRALENIPQVTAVEIGDALLRISVENPEERLDEVIEVVRRSARIYQIKMAEVHLHCPGTGIPLRARGLGDGHAAEPGRVFVSLPFFGLGILVRFSVARRAAVYFVSFRPLHQCSHNRNRYVHSICHLRPARGGSRQIWFQSLVCHRRGSRLACIQATTTISSRTVR